MRRFLMVTAALALSACANLAPISGDTSIPVPKIVGQDILDAADDANGFVSIGVLDANDPVVTCFNDAANKVRPPAVPAPSFQPKVSGLASGGVVAYGLAKKANKMAAVSVSTDCKAMIGQMVLDGSSIVNHAVLPGLIPGVRR